MFLLESQLRSLWGSPCMQLFFFLSVTFITTFCYFSYYVFWYRTLWVNFVGGSLCFLGPDVYFLPQIKQFSAIISSNKFSAPFSLSSLPGIPIMQMLLCLMMLLSSLNLFSVLLFFFLITVQFAFQYSVFQLYDPFF